MVNLNGKLLENSENALAVHNRGLHYGDALFETMRFAQNTIFFWEDHYFRLMSSMRILRMEIPMTFTMEFLDNEIRKTIASSKDKSSGFRVKMLVWRKTGGKYGPENNHVEYAIECEPLDNSFYTFQDSHCEVELYKDHFVYSGMLSTLKTNNKILNVLGSVYARENDYDNCLLLNEKKQVVEALNGNIFLVFGSVIKTPPIEDGCLNGIMRKQILAILRKSSQWELTEVSISPFELQKADEIFITNVISGIIPISKYRKKNYQNKVAQALVPQINLRAEANQLKEGFSGALDHSR